MMNAHDFSDFWQHCPTPAAAAAGFFYNNAGSTDSPYSNVVSQPRHLFAAAAAAASFEPNTTQIGGNSVSDCSLANNFPNQHPVTNTNSGAFTSNPFHNSFSSSFFGTNFGFPTTGSGFSFPTSTNRRQMSVIPQTTATSAAHPLSIGTPTGFVNFLN